MKLIYARLTAFVIRMKRKISLSSLRPKRTSNPSARVIWTQRLYEWWFIQGWTSTSFKEPSNPYLQLVSNQIPVSVWEFVRLSGRMYWTGEHNAPLQGVKVCNPDVQGHKSDHGPHGRNRERLQQLRLSSSGDSITPGKG